MDTILTLLKQFKYFILNTLLFKMILKNIYIYNNYYAQITCLPAGILAVIDPEK